MLYWHYYGENGEYIMKLLSEYQGVARYANRSANIHLEKRWSAVSQEFLNKYVIEYKTHETSDWQTIKPNSRQFAENAAENFVLGIDI